MYSQLFPFSLLNMRPDLFLGGLQAQGVNGDSNGIDTDANDNNEELVEKEIDDEEPKNFQPQLQEYGGGVKRLRISDIDKKPKIYSDNVNEMCLVKCKLCDRTLSHGSLRDHLLRSHNRKRQEFVTYEYVRLTYYRCKICDAETLFTHAAIAQHVRVYHNITFSEYKNNHAGFSGEIQTKLQETTLPKDKGEHKVPSANGSQVKEISFDNSLLAEHSLDVFMPKNNPNSLLEHLLRNEEKNKQSTSSSKEGEAETVDDQADPEESGVEESRLAGGQQEGESAAAAGEGGIISPMEFCDAKLTEDESDLNVAGEAEDMDGAEDSEPEYDPNMFCEMSMEETNEEDAFAGEEEGEGLEYSAMEEESSTLGLPNQDEREDGEVRIITDNLNEMCEFECLLCGMSLVESTLSKHLKDVHQESRKEGVTHKYKRLTYYKCKICDKEITFYFAALREHMVTRHNMKMPEYRARFKAFSNQHIVSDNINEMCLCRCNICEITLPHHKVKKHMKYKHNTTMKNLYTFIRQTYYRCKICLSEVLFSFDSIRNHLWNHHSLSMQDYKNTCKAFTGGPNDLDDGSSSSSSAISSETPSSGSSTSSSNLTVSPTVLPNHRSLPPMPKLKNFSHLVNQSRGGVLPMFNGVAAAAAGAAAPPVNPGLPPPVLKPGFINPFNISKEQLAYFLLSNSKTFSDKLSEMTLCKCKVCDEEILHHLLKKHMKTRHSCNLSKNHYDYIRETYYRCKICEAAVLFSFESIRRHVYQAHKLSLKEYRTQYNAFLEETSPEGIPEEEKVFSDDPKDMSICACKVCGAEHLHHLIMKHIRKKHGISSKDQYRFTKLVYYKCKVCGVDFPFSMLNISNHLIQNHKLTMTEYKRTYPAFSGVEMPPPPPKEEEKEKIFTDNLDERCICRCNVCGKEMYQDRLGKHSEINHKSKTGISGTSGRNEFVLKTYHKCRICHSELLFNLQGIRKHVRRAHDISMDEYKITYNPFTGGKGIRKGRPSKKNVKNLKKRRRRRREEQEERYMFHAMDDNELENRDDESDLEDPDFDPNKS